MTTCSNIKVMRIKEVTTTCKYNHHVPILEHNKENNKIKINIMYVDILEVRVNQLHSVPGFS